MKISTHFQFISEKEQIENEILRLKRSWEESMNQNKFWNNKYPHNFQRKITLAYGIFVSIEIYNKIREIYHCDIPIPQDTPELFGLKIRVMKIPEKIKIVDEKVWLEALE